MFTMDDVVTMIEVKIDTVSVRGYAVELQDNFGKDVEYAISQRLKISNGGWASVKVMVTPRKGRHIITGCGYLGGLNCRDHKNFLINGDYYQDTVKEALADLNKQAETLLNVLVAQKEQAVA